MRRATLVFLLVSLMAAAAHGQTPDELAAAANNCSGANQGTNANGQLLILGNEQHKTGNHWVSTGASSSIVPNGSDTNIATSCTYTHGTGTFCNVRCSITATNFSDRDPAPQDLITLGGSHFISHGWANGLATASNSANPLTCSAVLGGGGANCVSVGGSCVPLVTVAATPTGPSITVTTNNGTVVWSLAQSFPFTCGAVKDPQNQTADLGGGGCFQVVYDSSGFATLQTCGDTSPIIIDTEGEGFHLTSAANGVLFDIRGDGHPVQISWTATGSHNAFLALDRNGDGHITSGKELFGNFTLQPASASPNGFLALAEFDKPENGGNGDGVIDDQDRIFPQLVLWIDENHDGVSQPGEIHTLPELGIHSLSLNYFESRRNDEFGNQFRYKARVNPERDHRDNRDETPSGEPGRWAYDVFLITVPK